MLDFYIKKIIVLIHEQFSYIFTIFFCDKFILEQFFSKFYVFLQLVAEKFKNIDKFSFLRMFRLTALIVSYIFILIGIIFYI